MIQAAVGAGGALAADDRRRPGVVAVSPPWLVTAVRQPGRRHRRGRSDDEPERSGHLPAVEGLPSDRIIVLPNNKNIILTAQQAAGLTGKEVRVLSTTTAPQGLAAAMPYDRQADLDTLAQEMERAPGCPHRRADDGHAHGGDRRGCRAKTRSLA
jgi:dihydroxyacetone kinase-like predicted kinase